MMLESGLAAFRRLPGCVYAVIVSLGFIAPAGAAAEIRIGGTGTAIGTIRLLAAEFGKGNPDVQITIVPNLGSGGGIKAVTAGVIDIAVTSRPLREAEGKPGVVQLEYGRTPFVFAVSTKSRITSITRGELAEIYAGRKTAWSDGSPVRIVLRPASDIDTEMVKGISAEIRDALAVAERRPGVRFAVTDQEAASEIESIPGAIGPSSLALIVAEKRPLRALQLDGKQPATGDAASDSYPFLKKLFLVTGANRKAAADRFIAFVQSPAGRRILTGNAHLVP